MYHFSKKKMIFSADPGDHLSPNTPLPGVTIETTPATDPAVKPPVGK